LKRHDVWWIRDLLGWPIWVLFDDIAGFLEGLGRGGQFSRRQREPVAIPDVRSMPFNKAWETLVLAGFDVKVTRLERRPAPVMGYVVGQYPPAGRVTRRNTRVRITVHHPPDPIRERTRPPKSDEDGTAPRRQRVPDVRGLAFSEAWERLTLADFTVRVDRSRGDPRPVIGPVVAQHPPPRTLAHRWTRVRVTVAPGTSEAE
jgi:beta-lactam-binding protein with PASTA domain